MKSVLSLFFLALVGSAIARNTPGLVRPNGASNGKLGIYGGTSTTIQKHPYVAAILADSTFFCAGTILNNKWILTLGACLDGLSASDLTVLVGSNDASSGTKYSVNQTITHPSFSGLDYDVGLVQVKGTLKLNKKVKAAKLPTKEIANNAQLVAAGYGDTSAADASKLQQGTLKWLPRATCKSTYADYGFEWTARMACAQNKGKATLCSNDFGDALVKDNTVYGIFAAGATSGFCTKDALPGIFADIYPLVAWIKKNTAV